MAVRSANAQWNGNLKEGKGELKTETGTVDSQYSFSSRFESGTGTNPEELIAAAHAGCFTMALTGNLEKAGHKPVNVKTTDKVHIEKGDNGVNITKIEIHTSVQAEGIENEAFQKVAEETKNTCPVSKALTGTKFELFATLNK